LYDYQTVTSEPTELKAKNINPYLVDFADVLLFNRTESICKVPEISFGSMPNDDGNFLFTDKEKIDFLKNEPEAKKFIRPLISAREYINGEKRWCLWLKNAVPNEWRNLPMVADKVKQVKAYRLKSERETTRKLANMPSLFGEIRQPGTNYILIPRHSSENRKYIPMGFITKQSIASDSCLFIADASLFHFGILTSAMHMAWMKTVCGRIKSDFRYSNTLVYNNFPWPQNIPAQKIKNVEEKAKRVLKVRKQFPESSLADLYDPLSMPSALVKAHDELDKAVDNCYTTKTFPTELSRLEYLFDLYRKYTEPMFGDETTKKKKSK